MTLQPTSLSRLMGLPGEPTPLSFAGQIERGFPVSTLERIARELAPDDPGFKFRIVPKATLSRRRSAEPARLSPDESQRLARLAGLWSAALETWGTAEEARRFLAAPHPLLEGRSPLDLALGSDYGARLVEEILGRLRFGSAA